MWEIRVTPAGDFDNHALEYEHIKVEPLSGAMGAEVVGVRLPELSDAGFEVWALTPRRDATDIWSLAVPDRLAILLGAEGPGLSPVALDTASAEVRIPIASDVDSLNVAAAAAVAFAAIMREPQARSVRTLGS